VLKFVFDSVSLANLCAGHGNHPLHKKHCLPVLILHGEDHDQPLDNGVPSRSSANSFIHTRMSDLLRRPLRILFVGSQNFTVTLSLLRYKVLQGTISTLHTPSRPRPLQIRVSSVLNQNEKVSSIYLADTSDALYLVLSRD
jgi:hypothetical protein